jgi:hypothetical protein
MEPMQPLLAAVVVVDVVLIVRIEPVEMVLEAR